MLPNVTTKRKRIWLVSTNRVIVAFHMGSSYSFIQLHVPSQKVSVFETFFRVSYCFGILAFLA